MTALASRIDFVSFNDLVNWSVRYLRESRSRYKNTFSLIRIGDFLIRNRNIIEIQDGVLYTRVTIRLYTKGVLKRDEEWGRNIGTKRQFVVSPGQFIMSKIDARNGAFGLVSPELDGAVTTADFLSYNVDTSRINPAFLTLVSSTKEFLAICQSSSSGTTGRQRVDESQFLNIKIPLPSLAEQDRIVAAYNARIAEAERLEEQAKNLGEGIETLLKNELGLVFVEANHSKGLSFINFRNLTRWDNKGAASFTAKHDYKFVRDVCINIQTGTTPPTSRKEYFDGNINFFTPSDLGASMWLHRAERKVSDRALQENKIRVFPNKTLLFVGIGSTIGKVGLVQDTFATANQQLTGIEFDTKKILPEFAYIYFRHFQKITTLEKTQATLPIINQDKILNIPIPIPQMEVQRNLVNSVLRMNDEIREIHRQTETLMQRAIEEIESELFAS